MSSLLLLLLVLLLFISVTTCIKEAGEITINKESDGSLYYLSTDFQVKYTNDLLHPNSFLIAAYYILKNIMHNALVELNLDDSDQTWAYYIFIRVIILFLPVKFLMFLASNLVYTGNWDDVRNKKNYTEKSYTADEIISIIHDLLYIVLAVISDGYCCFDLSCTEHEWFIKDGIINIADISGISHIARRHIDSSVIFPKAYCAMGTLFNSNPTYENLTIANMLGAFEQYSLLNAKHKSKNNKGRRTETHLPSFKQRAPLPHKHFVSIKIKNDVRYSVEIKQKLHATIKEAFTFETMTRSIYKNMVDENNDAQNKRSGNNRDHSHTTEVTTNTNGLTIEQFYEEKAKLLIRQHSTNLVISIIQCNNLY